MRKSLLIIACSLVFPVQAAEAPNRDSLANSIVQELQAMYSRRPSEGQAVKFVVGNDLWQPRQQFKAGRNWLALACNVESCALESATLSVRQEFWQGHYDDKPTLGQRLNFKADSGSGREVVAWFSTAAAQDWIKPGTLTTYYSSQRPLKQPASRGTLEVTIGLPEGGAALVVPLLASKEFLNKVQPEQRHDWPLVLLQLRTQNKRQLLYGVLGTCSGIFHPRRYLLWAGDIDRDGKLDLLVSFVDADGPIHLYLSSAAKPDQLVGLAGIYDSPPFGGECDGPGGFMQFEGGGADGG